MAVRFVMRKSEVLKASGWSDSTLYLKIKQGKFPKWTKLDPEGQTSVWWADEVEAWQKGEWKAPEVANNAA